MQELNGDNESSRAMRDHEKIATERVDHKGLTSKSHACMHAHYYRYGPTDKLLHELRVLWGCPTRLYYLLTIIPVPSLCTKSIGTGMAYCGGAFGGASMRDHEKIATERVDHKGLTSKSNGLIEQP